MNRSPRSRALPSAVAVLLAMPCAAQICRLQELSWPDPQADARVGGAIGLHGDTLAAGGVLVDYATTPGGAVYVFRQQGGAYALEQKLQAPVGASFGHAFGRVVALHGDRLVVGANTGTNSVWLHRRTGSTWGAAVPLGASTAQYVAYHGHCVAIEGEWIAIGAPHAAVAPSTVRTGGVALLRDQAGVVTEVAVLKPPALTANDDIGVAVAMRGGVIVVGTAVGGGSASADQGRAVVYRLVNGQPVLEQELSVVGSNPGYETSLLIGSGATFGQVVATDGLRIAVGDRRADFGLGRVDVWAHQGGAWVHEGAVGGTGLGFAERIAIEGDDLVVSQLANDRVSHFRRVGGAWTLQHSTPSQPSSVFRVAGIALDGGQLALGSTLSQAPLANAGRVAVHELGAGSWPYGIGLAGSGGIVPRLDGIGSPRAGQLFAMDVRDGLGGSLGVLGFGGAPAQLSLFGGTAWIFPLLHTADSLLTGPLDAPGAGGFQVPIALPWASLIGVRVCFQAAVLDVGAPQGFALSNAVEIVVGP